MYNNVVVGILSRSRCPVVLYSINMKNGSAAVIAYTTVRERVDLWVHQEKENER